MILDKPTVQSFVNLIETESCPRCGELPGTISVSDPSEIVMEGCDHIVDATVWIDQPYG